MFLRQSTAVTLKFGPFVDSTDGVMAETGLTIAQANIRLSKNGGDITQSNNAAGATHDEAGYYDVPLDATDTNTLGSLKIMIDVSGALQVWENYNVITQNAYDAIMHATNGKIRSDLTSILGTALTESSGYIAAAFKKFFNVPNSVLTTASVNQTGDSYFITTTLAELVAIESNATANKEAIIAAMPSADAALSRKILTNKAVQNKLTGVIEYFDEDGETVLLTHTPSETETEITREKS